MRTRTRHEPALGARRLSQWAVGGIGALAVLLAACGPSGGASTAGSAPAGASGAAAAGASVSAAVSPGGETAGSAATAPTARPAPLKMVVSWSQPGGGQMGVWLPYEAGLFAEQGLDVELTHVSNTS